MKLTERNSKEFWADYKWWNSRKTYFGEIYFKKWLGGFRNARNFGS